VPPSEPTGLGGRSPSRAFPHVAVVVLTWNGRLDTEQCLASLSRSDWPRLTVIVVDNGSTDGTVEWVRRTHPGVDVMVNDVNLGFAEGNNVGLGEAVGRGADYVLVLNNDTTVATDAITEMVTAASELSDAAAVCPLILFSDPPDLIWYAGATFDPTRSHSGRMTGYRELDEGQHNEVKRVDRAVGAAMLIPRQAIDELGFFDRQLFLYYEDVEWSLRARSRGLSIYLAPSARVWHAVSAAAGGEESLTSAYYGTRNHLHVLEQYAPLNAPARMWRRVSVLAVHAAAARRSRRPIPYLRAVASGCADAIRGRLGRRPIGRAHGS